MSFSINIPEDLYQQAAGIAKIHRVSADEVFASAFVEQLASWRLRERAARGQRDKYFAVLDNVPDIEPDLSDRI